MELLVVVAIIALLISILLPTLGRAKEAARQAVCLANLSGIQKGWVMYAGENRDRPPILPDINQATADYADDLRMGDECTAAALGEGAQQNLCLLVKIGVVQWNMFICPSSENKEANRTGAGRKFGLGETVAGENTNYCDYAIQIPYKGQWVDWAQDYENRCPLDKHISGGVPILADRPPEGSLTSDWSANHPDDGESLLYADGHVRFSKDENADGMKNTGGWCGDNFYTHGRWDTTDKDNPMLISNYSSVKLPRSTKDAVLYWWGP